MTAALKPVSKQRRSQAQLAIASVSPADATSPVALVRPTSRAEIVHARIAPLSAAPRPSIPYSQVRSLPTQPVAPPWLTAMVWTQKATAAIAGASVVAALAVYGWTVYTQQLWSREYRKFEILQRQERQLVAADEVLKNQMARQAESPESQLVLPGTQNTVFLPAPPQHLVPVMPPPIPQATSSPPPPNRPLGY